MNNKNLDNSFEKSFLYSDNDEDYNGFTDSVSKWDNNNLVYDSNYKNNEDGEDDIGLDTIETEREKATLFLK